MAGDVADHRAGPEVLLAQPSRPVLRGPHFCNYLRHLFYVFERNNFRRSRGDVCDFVQRTLHSFSPNTGWVLFMTNLLLALFLPFLSFLSFFRFFFFFFFFVPETSTSFCPRLLYSLLISSVFVFLFDLNPHATEQKLAYLMTLLSVIFTVYPMSRSREGLDRELAKKKVLGKKKRKKKKKKKKKKSGTSKLSLKTVSSDFFFR